MDIAVKQVGQVSLVSIVGSVDALTAPEVMDCLESQLARGQAHLVLDLGQTDFTSSSGLRVLLTILRKSRQQGGDLRLAAVQPAVLRVLRLAGITEVLQVLTSVEEAVARFEQEGLDVEG